MRRFAVAMAGFVLFGALALTGCGKKGAQSAEGEAPAGAKKMDAGAGGAQTKSAENLPTVPKTGK